MVEPELKSHLETYFDDLHRIDLFDQVLERYRTMGWAINRLSPTSAQVNGAGITPLVLLAFGIALGFGLVGMAFALFLIYVIKTSRMIESMPDGTVIVTGVWTKQVIHERKTIRAPNTLSLQGAITITVILGIVSTCLWTLQFL